MKDKDEKNIHAGHRKRMMARYEENGFDEWPEHEVVEVLLYSVLPRINTNVIAHRLINTFGSLKNLFEADQHEIEKVRGIGPVSAKYLAETRSDVSEAIREQYTGAKDINVYQLAFLADWFMRDKKRPVGMIIYDQDDAFVDYVCLPYRKIDDVVDADFMFSELDRDLTNHTVSLFVKPDQKLSEDDVAAVRRYTFTRSIILDEVFLMNRLEPVPTLHPENPPIRIDKIPE